MLNYPQIDPVIFQVGPVAVRWYGVMYLLGFVSAYFLILRLAPRRGVSLDRDGVADYLFYAILGVVVGGRLGYALFYNAPHFLAHPLEVLAIWQGGMSFHGGLLGVVVASILFCRRRGIPMLPMGDVLVTASTVGIGCGRIGNFINAELWGRVTDLPWGMVFPGAGSLPRHPSQLYEAFLEGLVLFLVLSWLIRRRVSAGIPFFTFILLYGVFRILVEIVREPDAHLGLMGGLVSRGQLLSIPMVLLGVAGILFVRKRTGTYEA